MNHLTQVLWSKDDAKCLYCERPKAEGWYPTCCRTCKSTRGAYHGPKCSWLMGEKGNVRELRNEADKFVLGLPESSPTNTKNGVQLSIQQALKNPPSGLNNQLAAAEKNLIAQELT